MKNAGGQSRVNIGLRKYSEEMLWRSSGACVGCRGVAPKRDTRATWNGRRYDHPDAIGHGQRINPSWILPVSQRIRNSRSDDAKRADRRHHFDHAQIQLGRSNRCVRNGQRPRPSHEGSDRLYLSQSNDSGPIKIALSDVSAYGSK